MSDVKRIIEEMTLKEKVALCSGVTSWRTTKIARLNIPSIFMADGPHGIRKEVTKKKMDNISAESIPSTCFPPAVTLASSWDRELLYEVGKALAEEAKEQEVATVLGPGINIKRNPLCGRNFEYFSEDPFLSAEMGIAYVKGLQDNGVGASLKHFAANSQEFMRLSASSEVDERTLREIYLYAFEKTIKESNPYTVMCSYNPINEEFASQNKYLLHDILKKEWGYDGIVVSDWGAVSDRVKGIEAGLHLEMPSSGGIRDKWIEDAVKNGELSEERLNEIVEDLLRYIFKCDCDLKKAKGFQADYDGNHLVARRAATEGSVLLKNDGILPLKDLKGVGVVGALAKDMRTQGTGSSKLKPRKTVSFIDAMNNLNIEYSFAPAYDVDTDETSEKLLEEARLVALNSEIVLLFVGLTDQYESESYDRDTLDIPKSHSKLIEVVTNANKNVVIILTGGSPSLIDYDDNVRGILNVYLTGEAGGEALFDLLTGKENPSGKLAETFPLSLDSVLSTKYFAKEIAEYREGIYVGYRYFDTAKKEVKYPFGYGLSYSSFEYSNLTLKALDKQEFRYLVSFDVKNTSTIRGKEVVQLYVKDVESILFRPEKELKAFEKITLEPNETKSVEMTLDKRAFAFYNVSSRLWEVEDGVFEIFVGKSSKEICLSTQINIKGDASFIPDYKKLAPSYFNISNVEEIPEREFEILLNKPLAKYEKPQKGNYTLDTCVYEFNVTPFSRWLRRIVEKYSVKVLPKWSTPAEKKMVVNGALSFPVRNLFAMTGGLFGLKTTNGLLFMLNGKFLKGLFTFLFGFFERKPNKKKDYPSEE